MTSYTTDGTVGPWAKEKLDCLEKYLDAYTKVFLKQSWWCKKTVFVDAFAGAGRARIRNSSSKSATQDSLFEAFDSSSNDEEADKYLDGSPRKALEITHPFSRYFFIEQSSKRVDALNALKEEFQSNRSIEILEGDAATEIENQIIGNSEFNWENNRGVIFLDPFGMQVPWSVIETISKTNALEIILNLPVGHTLQRLLPRTGQFTSEKRLGLDQYFGTDEWFDVIYEKSPGLFGDEISKFEKAGERLTLWYRSRLKNTFGKASSARLIKNSRGGHLYYLIWAGHHPKGYEIAEDIFLSQGEAIS